MKIFIAVIVSDHEIYPEAFVSRSEAEAWVLQEFNGFFFNHPPFGKPLKKYKVSRMDDFVASTGASWMWSITDKDI